MTTTQTTDRDEKTMTQRRKTFRGGQSIDEFEPVEFDLRDKTFKCKSAIQGAVLLEFVARADSESGGAAAGAIYDFFKDCMEPEEYERFHTYINDPYIIFDMETIGEIASWLVEEYTARPTQPSVSLVPGPSSAGPTSTVPPSSDPAAPSTSVI